MDMRIRRFTWREIVSYHTGSDFEFEVEHRLLNVVGFFGGLIALAGAVVNLIVGSSVALTLVCGLMVLFTWGVFYLSRMRCKFNLAKYLITFAMFVVMTYFYFANNGSEGPILFLYLSFFLLMIFIWKGRGKIFVTILFLANITVLFFLEYKNPAITAPYPDHQSRILDVFLSFYLYVLMVGVIMAFAKKSLVKEKQKAQKSDHLKTAFLANMSHEIRTPMNAILGFTQLLYRDLSQEKKEAYLKVINDNSNSLLRLIEDIIDISKIEAGELEIREVDCDPCNVVREVAATFRQRVSELSDRNIDIFDRCDPLSHYVIADDLRVKQVLVNLVSNAVKYTTRGNIAITMSVEDQWLRFTVKDTGTGIREDDISEIFDRFRKIETEDSLNVQSGTGIGLSISKNLIQLMGGDITVSSEFGFGSEFSFTIPKKLSDKPIPRKREGHVKAALIDKSALTGMKILVAEDEPMNYEFLKKALERLGVESDHARDGQQAVELVSYNTYDLVLMDMMMPVMNGFEATLKIKELKPELPVIAQTALAMEGDSGKINEAGCDDYITKPIRMNVLQDTLLRYLGRRSAAAS